MSFLASDVIILAAAISQEVVKVSFVPHAYRVKVVLCNVNAFENYIVPISQLEEFKTTAEMINLLYFILKIFERVKMIKTIEND